MPPPQKVYKNIIHDDTMYKWIMQNRTGVNELLIELTASVNGQILQATLPKVVSLDMVRNAIDFGRDNGWVPEESGPPFKCRYTQRKLFVRVHED
ncbi:MAG: hypothetical protein QM627_07330 [Luteolibacter sp.]